MHLLFYILVGGKEGSVTVSKQRTFVAWTVSDYRPSAITTGTIIGLLCCVIPILAIVIQDLPTLHLGLLRAAYNIAGNARYNRQRQTKMSQGKNRHYHKQTEKRRGRKRCWDLGAEVAVTEESEA